MFKILLLGNYYYKILNLEINVTMTFMEHMEQNKENTEKNKNAKKSSIFYNPLNPFLI